MWHLKILVFVYLASLLSIPVAVWMGIDIQILLRIPGMNIRWMDVVIATTMLVSGAAFLKSLSDYPYSERRGSGLLSGLIVLFIGFEFVQLVRTYGAIDLNAQISLFLAFGTVAVLLWFALHDVDETIHQLILVLSLGGACVLTIRVGTEIAGFGLGFLQRTTWDRASLIVLGSQETISDIVIVTIVLLHATVSRRLSLGRWKIAVYAVAMGALFIDLVLLVHRGVLIVWASVLFVFAPLTAGWSPLHQLRTLFSVGLVLVLTLFLFGDTLTSLGYSPIDTLKRTVGYATDVDNPNWDKGRAAVLSVAISVWLDNIWFGVGYDEVQRYAGSAHVSPHNALITSLFHRGLVGTVLFLSIIAICYWKSVSLWKLSGLLPDRQRILNRCLVFAAWLYLVPFLTQEIVLDKYSQSIQYLVFGTIVSLDRHYRKQVHETSQPRILE